MPPLCLCAPGSPRINILGSFRKKTCEQVLEACAPPPLCPTLHVLTASTFWRMALGEDQDSPLPPKRPADTLQSLWLGWEVGQRKVLQPYLKENNSGGSLGSASLQAEMSRDWEKRHWTWVWKNWSQWEIVGGESNFKEIL